MARRNETSTTERQILPDHSDIDEDLWTSPYQPKPQALQGKTQSYDRGTTHGNHNTREEALRQDLQTVRQVNEAIEGAIESLAKARNSLKTVNTTVSAALSLLSIWTKILSQTELNQRLILNPSWQGMSQDLVDSQQEVFVQQQAAERREQEELDRRAAAARKAEDDERRRADAAARIPKGMSRGRGKLSGRGGGTPSGANTSFVGFGGQGAARGTTRGSSAGRRTNGSSGIGRGISSGRGRSRG